MRGQERDENEPEIIQALQRCGTCVLQADRMAGYDFIAVTPRGIHLVEVKNPTYRWKLTPREAKVKRMVELAGGAYYVIETVDEAVGLAMHDSKIILQILGKEVRGELQHCQTNCRVPGTQPAR